MNRLLVGCCVVLSASSAAVAGFDTDQPYALGGDRTYVQVGAPTHYQGIDSFFDITYRIDFASPPIAPPPPGGSGGGGAGGSSLCQVSLNGLPPGTRYIGNFACSFFDVFAEISPDGATRTYNTEMLSLDLFMQTPFGPMMIRESPTLASTGRYSITDIGNGMFHVDSFFDVFTELSLDGGQTWMPASGSTRLEILPAPGALALLGMGGRCFGGRRRRA